MNCVECKLIIDQKEEHIKCNVCKTKVVHVACANVKRGPGRPTKQKWKCEECKLKDELNTNSENSEEENIENKSTQEMLIELFKKLNKVEKNTNEIPDIKNSLNFLEEMYENQKQQLANQEKSIKKLSSEMDEVKTKLKAKDDELCLMSSRVHELEQLNLGMYVEVHNIEMLPGEKTFDIVEKISQNIGISAKPNTYVEDAYRVPVNIKNSRKASLPPLLVVRFKCNDVRNAWLDKQRTADITSGTINNNNNYGKMKVYEKLTPHYRQLLWKTRTAATELKFKYTWSKGGKIFVRKSDDLGTIRIFTENDIYKKMGADVVAGN